jgi:hypothetical protein
MFVSNGVSWDLQVFALTLESDHLLAQASHLLVCIIKLISESFCYDGELEDMLRRRDAEVNV